MGAIMKKTLLLSFCCHLSIFSLFSFTFGEKLSRLNFPSVYFLGAILTVPDLETPRLINRQELQTVKQPLKILPLPRANRGQDLVSFGYIKPQPILAFGRGKPVFSPKTIGIPLVLDKSSSVVMLYPRLPQHFLLYFKDRQSVHIELVFSLVSRGRTKAIIVNRKISSGNLEVDLLSKRYLGHYLFVRQAAFPEDARQTVKIDLSAKESIME